MSARALAHELVNAVSLRGESLSGALDAARARHPHGEARAFAAAQDLSYGVLRAKGRLDFFLGRLLRQAPQPAELRGLLLVGLFELDRPETPDYAAVNEAVNLAGRLYPRAKGLVNAVLRNFQRRRGELDGAARESPEAFWNFPDWWRERLAEQFPDTWEDVLETMNRHPPMTLRVNRRVTTPEAYSTTLEAAAMPCRRLDEWSLTLAWAVPVRDLPGFATGQVSVQDLGAQYAAPLLDAAAGMRVLDACAAPGGKTGHLLELHDLDLLALDNDAARLARVDDNLRRLGLRAETRVGDAGQPETWWDGRPFERILLDAPCSASGVARRHPDGKWLKRPEDATQLAARQARLLDAVWPLLKPGGKLLYATCSLFKEENEERIEHFLRCHADARREALTLPGGRGGQLLPGADHDGFYYARCVKT